MRHLWTLIAAVVIAPLTWLLLAYGQDRSLQAFANEDATGSFDTGDFVRPVACLAAAGLLLGLIASLRFSPLGATLTGAVYTASYVALMASPDTVMDLIPNNISVAGRDADPATPVRTGVTMLLGALLLMAVVSVSRWRRWPASEEATPEPAAQLPENRPLGGDGLGLTAAPRSPYDSADEPHPWPSNRR